MPDLLSHTLLNAALPVGTLRPRHLLVFVVGGVLPDLAARVPGLTVSRVVQPMVESLDLDWLIIGTGFLHLPLGVLILALFGGAVLPPWLLGGVSRWTVVRLLLAGAAVHLLLDMGQRHLRPGYNYLFPFSMHPCELGLYSAEASLTWWPWLVPLSALSVGWTAWRWRQNEARPGG